MKCKTICFCKECNKPMDDIIGAFNHMCKKKGKIKWGSRIGKDCKPTGRSRGRIWIKKN